MSTAMTKPGSKNAQPPATTNNLTVLNHLLETHRGQIEAALPKHMTPERMIRIALSAVSRTPILMQCTPLSLASAVVQSSVLGLEPNTVMGESYLVPFWNSKLQVAGKEKPGGYEAQLIPGYMGLLKLARNSGELSVFDAQIVYSNDEFDFEKGSTVFWRHKWAREGERGYSQGAWAGYVLRDKSMNFEYMTIPQIEEHRDRYSQGAYEKKYGEFVLDSEGNRILTGAWADSPEWMYKKTVIRQTVKLMPKSTDKLNKALELDDYHDTGRPQPVSDVLPQSFVEDPEATGEEPHREPKRKSQVGSSGGKTVEPTTAPTEPKATTTDPTPGTETTTVKPTPAADMDPKKIKPLAGTLKEIADMKGTHLKEGAWWAIMGNAGYTSLEEIPVQAEALMLLGIMKERAK
jgi:recombination protein RecT